jgi:hypothetical protein
LLIAYNLDHIKHKSYDRLQACRTGVIHKLQLFSSQKFLKLFLASGKDGEKITGPPNESDMIIEGSLEVKLPTMWTDGKAEVGRLREEKRSRTKIREGVKKTEERKCRRAKR